MLLGHKTVPPFLSSTLDGDELTVDALVVLLPDKGLLYQIVRSLSGPHNPRKPYGDVKHFAATGN
jgi:hypothetical protein